MNTRRASAVMAVAIVAAAAGGAAGQTAPPQPITIQDAVTEALDHNLSLLAERHNVSVAQAAVVTAGLRPNPVVTISAMRPDTALVEEGLGMRDTGVRTDYVFERGAKRERRLEQATLARSVAELQLLDTARRLVLDVETAFADVQLAKLNLALAQESLSAFTNVVAINVERVRTGDLAQVELARSRLAALQFENDVQQQAVKLDIARSRLASLLGRDAGASLDVTGELRRDAGVLDRSVLQAQALETRPDVRAARTDQARSTADLRLQLADAKIDFTVSGEYHRQEGGGMRGNAYGVFFSAPLPVFSRNQGEIARADAQRLQTEARTRALEAGIHADIDAAFAEYASARRIVERIETDMLAQARDVRTTMEYSYRRGEASFVEFLDAVRAFNETTRSYNEARADYARSLYTLDALSGKVSR